MAPKTRYGRPLAHTNPNTKCWLNAVMVMLSVFQPFHDTLASTDKSGPVTDMLREHFKNPPLCRGSGRSEVVDTSKVVRNLRIATEQHQNSYQASACQARQFLGMLNTTRYQDPGECWNLLYAMVRTELGTTAETSHIGVKVKEHFVCSKCRKARMNECENQQYLYHALELRTMLMDKYPSVQASLQSLLAPDQVEVRCCQKAQDIKHDTFCECLRGGSGMVFYAPFADDNVHTYAKTDFEIENEIRLPYLGPASGLQSSYSLIGFTARYVDKAHHFAVIFDKQDLPWVIDDDTTTKGLPEGGWVPMLMCYELWHPDAATIDVHFPVLQLQGNDGGNRQATMPHGSDNSDASPVVSPQECTTFSGRTSQLTDRYRPDDTLRKKPKAQTHKGTRSSEAPKPAKTTNNSLLQSQQRGRRQAQRPWRAKPN